MQQEGMEDVEGECWVGMHIPLCGAFLNQFRWFPLASPSFFLFTLH